MAEKIKNIPEDVIEEQEDNSTFTYTFKKPFSFDGKTVEKLNFDWSVLTAKDSNAVEAEIRKRGVMIITAESTPEYWGGLAVRACTDRDEHGIRILDSRMMDAMPAPDYKRICNNLRTFFLLVG